LVPIVPEKGRKSLALLESPTIQPDVFGMAGVAHHQIDRAHMEAEWRDRPAPFRQPVPVAERQVRDLTAT
jgi:hypothetical protein